MQLRLQLQLGLRVGLRLQLRRLTASCSNRILSDSAALVTLGAGWMRVKVKVTATSRVGSFCRERRFRGSNPVQLFCDARPTRPKLGLWLWLGLRLRLRLWCGFCLRLHMGFLYIYAWNGCAMNYHYWTQQIPVRQKTRSR